MEQLWSQLGREMEQVWSQFSRERKRFGRGSAGKWNSLEIYSKVIVLENRNGRSCSTSLLNYDQTCSVSLPITTKVCFYVQFHPPEDSFRVKFPFKDKPCFEGVDKPRFGLFWSPHPLIQSNLESMTSAYFFSLDPISQILLGDGPVFSPRD